MKFHPGHIVATPGALEAISASKFQSLLAKARAL
jgi:hypothetical protein